MSDRRIKSERSNVAGELENKNFYQVYKKMYLDCETADVHFICAGSDGETERVPAHKLLLSVASEGFKALFDAAETGQTEFKLEETSVVAFKEFLQFFYMPKVKLTIENISAVMELAKNYGNEDFLFLCCLFLEHRMTTDKIIWGYGLALRFGRTKMKEYCEKKISESAGEVFKSKSFLDCERDVLEQILQFNALKCDEFHVLTGCLAWAKASAERKGLESPSTPVLREELGNLLYQIRFRSMTMANFSSIVGSYAGFFTAAELEQIIQMIASKDFTSDKFDNKFRGSNGKLNNGSSGDKASKVVTAPPADVIECNRFHGYATSRYYVRPLEKTRFLTNKTVELTGFDCGLVMSITQSGKTSLPAKVTIIEGPKEESPTPTTLFMSEAILSSETEAHVTLTEPITIQKDCKYEIQLEQNTTKDHFNQIVLKKECEMKDGIKIRFLLESTGWDDSKFGLITKMYFKRPNTPPNSV